MIAWIVVIAAITVVLFLFAEFALLAITLLIVGALVSTETTIGNVLAVAVIGGLVWLKTSWESH
jgi:hypothetical protein